MAEVIVRLKKANAAALGTELHAYEIGLELKDVGCDANNKNYGVYHKVIAVPFGDVVLLPDNSVPPTGATLIEKGPLVVGGVKQVFAAYRLATEG